MSGDEASSAVPFEARYSIPGHAAVFASTQVLLVPTLWLLVAGLQNGQWLVAGVGSVGIAFFGPIAIAVLMRMADRKVRLRITDDTFWLPDHSQTAIPRRSIKQVSDRGLWLALYLHSPGRFPPTSRFRRFVKFINPGSALRDQYGDVWLYPALLSCSRRELLERI